MNKQTFLDELKTRLWSMAEADRQRSLDYYREMIDDRMEDGLSEEEAVAAIGDLDEIVKQILAETPRPPVAVKPVQPQPQQRSNGWLIVLLILGSPLWIPLIAAAVSVVISIYVSLWSVVIALYAVAFAVGIAAIGCVVGSFFMIGRARVIIITLGAALLCAGLSILLFLLSVLATKGMVALTKLCWQACQRIFTRKERKV